MAARSYHKDKNKKRRFLFNRLFFNRLKKKYF